MPDLSVTAAGTVKPSQTQSSLLTLVKFDLCLAVHLLMERTTNGMTSLTLAALQKTVFQWAHVDRDCSDMYRLTDAQGATIETNAADLTLLDPRLPRTIVLLTTAHTTCSRQLGSWEHGRLLRDTVRYWYQTHVLELPGYPLPIDRVFEVYVSAVESDTATVKFMGLVVENHEGIDLVLSKQWFNATVTHTWCEQNFPGSVARLKIAEALAMGPREWADWAFTAPTPEAALPLPADLITTLD